MVNRYETNILNTAAQGVEMCKRIGAPNVKVHLDVYHMNIEESDMASAIVETGPHLGYFHTGDSHRGYLGSGTIDLAGVFRALVRAKYGGRSPSRASSRASSASRWRASSASGATSGRTASTSPRTR